MADEREDRVRERAYAIWEREGRPEGRHEEHWRQASQEMAGGEGAGQQQGGMSSDSMDRAPGGLSTDLQPGGTVPGGGAGAGMGGIGTGGGSTAGEATGTLGRKRES